MDLSLERENSALGSLFQQIINDLKNTSPLWEDFLTKATKLHQCLRAAIQAIAAYLDAFQKIADAATNSRGASKEIGTALTRVCLRHKAVESRLKTFTTAIMDCLVQPLQEKLEDWKRTVITIDKEHAKEYKRCRTELKKRSSDTLRLQKKARKGQSDTIQSLMDTHMQDVTLRRAELEEVEKKSLRSAMIEERLRYCTFVHMLQPVVKEECEVMSELGHLQEAMDSIAIVTKDPSILPQASEELIHDTKATKTLYPESPGGGSGSQGGCSNSLGSRKSSVCSISSMNSSGSSNSPGHHHYPRSLSQLISPAIRLKPGESSDSGFCSSPALTTQASTATSQSHAVSTWPPHCQDAVPVLPPAADRPHTISTAYEKGHQRPPLTVYTFQNPETILEGSGGSGSIPGTPNGASSGANSGANTPSTQKSSGGSQSRPPLPVRCSSLERPLSANNNRSANNLLQRQCPSPIPAHITKELTAHHAQQQHMQQQQQQQQQLQHQQQQIPTPPTYVNMSELATMAAQKITNQQQQRPVAALQQQHSIDSISSQFSNDSNASSGHYQTHQQQQQQQQTAIAGSNSASKTRSHSVSSSSASSNTPSLHSHPSIESGTVTTPLVGQTPTPSSGSSTPQNHYSPLLTNSPSSTAAGTPSGGSMTSGVMSGFVYNVNSPTPPQSGTTSIDSDVLKITETDSGGQHVNKPTNETNQQQHELNQPNNAAMAGNIITNSNSQPNPPTDLNEQININTTNNKTSNDFDTESSNIVENDECSRASVLQKASMFEKQAAAAAASTPTVVTGRTNTEAIYGTRRNPEDVYRATTNSGNHFQQSPQQQQQQPQQQHEQHTAQQDVDKSFEDSIQELNNLIGELDSFQREIDASKRSTAATPNTNNTTATTVHNVGGESTDASDYATRTTTNAPTTTPESDNNITSSTPLTITCPTRPPKSPQCASNQTSGCGTDISDATSDEIAADIGSLSTNNEQHQNSSINNERTLQQYNSETELSRCYVSETSSLAGGYENPTFAHFATAASSTSIAASSGVDEPTDAGSLIGGDSRSLMAVSSTTTGDDSISHNSETYAQQQYNATDNVSECGSNVVVIYDHQIPITPDIDYVKQNSEIVVLRTKDPLQQQMARQEMRELTQLPANLCGGVSLDAPGAGMMSMLALSTSSSLLSCSVPTSPPHTATVAPAKQRLSSFRASSEQQLQLIGCGESQSSGSELSLLRAPHHNAYAGTTQNAQDEFIKGGNTRRVETPPNAHNNSDTIIRARKAALPPKPSLSIFNGQMALDNLLEANSNSNNNRVSCEAVGGARLLCTPPPPAPPPPLVTKANFKADLDAKIRKQKLKLQLQHEQQQKQALLQQKQKLLQEQQQLQQQQQQEQHSPQSAANNTNTPPIYLSSNHNHNHSNNNTNSKNNTNNTTHGNRNSSGAHNSNSNTSNNNNNCNAISLTKRNGSSAPIPNSIPTKTINASASASSSASPSNHMAFVVKSASSSSSASSSPSSAPLVYQNGTKSSISSSNNNNSSKIASSSLAYPKLSKQTHSNRNYQFHALKSHNNINNNAHSSRPKRTASMSSSSTQHQSINPLRAPPSPTPSTLSSPSLLSLSFRHTSSSRSSTGHVQCQPTTPPPPLPQKRLTLDAMTSAAQKNHKPNVHNTVVVSSSSSIPSSVSVTSCTYASSTTCGSATPPPPIHTNQSAASATVSATSASKSNINSAIAKPNVTPRPASLSGGVTRIARRSSVNTSKPPPPVRRSSSVTPSHNATGTGASQSSQQNQYQQPHQQQFHQQPSQNSQYDNVDSLPPPPAYLLDSRPTQSTPTPPPPSTISAMAMPSSSLKVAETVKALSAMRHKPASPNSIRNMQQQQHQHHHQQQQQLQQHMTLQPAPPLLIQTPTPPPSFSPTLQQNIYSTTVKSFSSTALLLPNTDFNTDQPSLHYDAYSYYNPYVEVKTQLSAMTKMPFTNANYADASYPILPLTPIYHYHDGIQPTTKSQQQLQQQHETQLQQQQDAYGSSSGGNSLRTTPIKGVGQQQPVSPSYTSPPPYDFQHSKIELPPPLPPPNPNQQRSLKQQQQQQQHHKPGTADQQHMTQFTTQQQQQHSQHYNSQQQQQQKRQYEELYDYLPTRQHLQASPKQQYNNKEQQQQQQHLYLVNDALLPDHVDEPETIYSDNGSFRTSSPGIYAQPKIVTSMSSFRSASPASNDHHSNQHHHAIPPTQPKTNPNLIAQLSARLNKQNQQQQQQQQHNNASEGTYGSTPNSPSHHNHQHHQSEPVYMRNYTHPHNQQQQQQSSATNATTHHQQQQQQQNYDGKSIIEKHNNKVYGSFSNANTIQSSSQATATTVGGVSITSSSNSTPASTHFSHTSSTSTNFNASPHFPLSSSTSSLLSKVTSFASNAASTAVAFSSPTPTQSSSTSHYHTTTRDHHHHHHQHNQSQHNQYQSATTQNAAQNLKEHLHSNIYSPSPSITSTIHTTSTTNKNATAAQPARQQQQTYAPPSGAARQHYIAPMQSQQQQQHQRGELHHSCPPPLENPPPPPNNTAIYAATANNAGSTTTMPKNMSRASGGGGGSAATYAPPSGTMTLPKNLAQQRLQQQQYYQQQQQQQYHHPNVGAIAGAQQQHSQPASVNQRSQMPLPHHQQQQQQQQQQMTYKQKSATLQSNHRQPPVPSRHSSAQQKIFVATNPFIQTTAIHCHSPASSSAAHSQPASPTCSSPSSLASIYGTSSRSHHHHHHHHGSGGDRGGSSNFGNSGGAAGNGGGHGYYAAPHNSTSYASSNIDKAGSIRAKTKAEFLENLNAKLAKQGLSGRAFAVRNLINSKALPDPRICHESLMDQIKRGATLKRNQKINDRSAPKIL